MTIENQDKANESQDKVESLREQPAFVDLASPADMAVIMSKRTDSPVAELAGTLLMSDRQYERRQTSDYSPKVGPREDTMFTNGHLAQMVTPKNIDNSPFKAFEDLSALTDEADKVPKGRHNTGLYARNENYWIEAINIRIAAGDIDKNTLVISDTGHSPAIAYVMAQKFHSDIFLNLPANQVTGTIRGATQDQMQTFAQGIKDGVDAGPREGASTLLGVNLHQEGSTAQSVIDKLPSAEQLKAMGITKVFLCTELRDGSQTTDPYEPKNLPGIRSYLDKLKAAGVNVVEGNCDIRPQEDD